jgi:hypothetical protein
MGDLQTQTHWLGLINAVRLYKFIRVHVYVSTPYCELNVSNVLAVFNSIHIFVLLKEDDFSKLQLLDLLNT